MLTDPVQAAVDHLIRCAFDAGRPLFSDDAHFYADALNNAGMLLTPETGHRIRIDELRAAADAARSPQVAQYLRDRAAAYLSADRWGADPPRGRHRYRRAR